jgi:hypothetical protein
LLEQKALEAAERQGRVDLVLDRRRADVANNAKALREQQDALEAQLGELAGSGC